MGARRVICVVGSEGGGDRLRRVALGRVAEQNSDRVVLTTDNPRSEDPDQIIAEIMSMVRKANWKLVRVIPPSS